MKRSDILRFSLVAGFTLVVSLVTFGVTAGNSKDKLEKKPPTKTVEAQAAEDSIPVIADSVRVLAPAEHRVVAYYFHGDVRCASCRKIEAYTKDAVDSAFAEALESGQLEWRVINTDSSQNAHFLQDYQLYTKSVIISDVHNGKQARWKNLEKVWELLGDQTEFHTYIQDEIRLFLDRTK